MKELEHNGHNLGTAYVYSQLQRRAKLHKVDHIAKRQRNTASHIIQA